ncbi:MAG: DMT family transporter [Phycisphaerae bacterium]
MPVAILGVMSDAWVGKISALAAAFTWSLALILFKRSGETLHPLALNAFKNTVGLLLLMATLVFAGEDLTVLVTAPPGDLCILILSGIVGIAVADTLLFHSLNLLGVGLLTIAECAYAPSVVAVAWFFLGERITAYQYIGGALILLAVLLCAGHNPPMGRTRGQVLGGMALGLTAIMLMAIGIVVAKPVLEDSPLILASTLRLAGGSLILIVWMAVRPDRARYFAVFRPTRVWRICIPASVLGTYLAMIFWVAGFKYGQAGVAAVLNQTSTILALVFATLILKEPFTKRKATAAIVALAGVIIITAYSGG